MNAYAYSSDLWPSFVSTALIAALAWYGWRHRNVPGALPLAIACLFAVAWSVGSMLQTAAVDPGTKIFWLRFVTTLAAASRDGRHLLRDPVRRLEPLADPPHADAAGCSARWCPRP